MASKTTVELRAARHDRLRKRIEGTSERPRLAVFRSSKHIYAQIIDDTKGHTLVAASSVEKEVTGGGNKDGAKQVGAKLAERAKADGVAKPAAATSPRSPLRRRERKPPAQPRSRPSPSRNSRRRKRWKC